MSVAGLRNTRIRNSLLLMLGIGLSLLSGWVVANNGLQPLQSHRKNQDRTAPASASLELISAQVAAHPRDWRWAVLLARTQLSQGDQEAAALTLKRLRALHPNHPDVIALSSLLALKKGQLKPEVDQVKKLFKQSTPKQRLKLGLVLADLQRQAGELTAARSSYELLIKENPDRAEPLLALALLKRDQGEGDRALTLLRQAERLEGGGDLDQRTLESTKLSWALEAARNQSSARRLAIKEESQPSQQKEQAVREP